MCDVWRQFRAGGLSNNGIPAGKRIPMDRNVMRIVDRHVSFRKLGVYLEEYDMCDLFPIYRQSSKNARMEACL
jgi:hypothetical protein